MRLLDSPDAEEVIRRLRRLAPTAHSQRELEWRWAGWRARPAQLMPKGTWLVWLLLAGRGFGKTRAGAEAVRAQVKAGRARRIALVAPTLNDVRDVMVEGPSGVLAVSPPWERPRYEPSNRRLIWPNGAVATCFSADEPERLRGPQHDLAWCDELAAWRYPQAWDMLMLGLRLGRPRAIVTTTPKPTRLVRALATAPTTVLTRGSTFDNTANLAPAFLDAIAGKYKGTALGRQEIDAELLEEADGALWKRRTLAQALIAADAAPEMKRIVVAIDPAVSALPGSDETGIVAAGVGIDGLAYVLNDRSGRYTPDEWARRAVLLYDELAADRVIGEVNNGGDLIEATLRTVRANLPFKALHASHGKRTRAEPVAALYEQGKVRHAGLFAALEDQLCTFEPGAGAPSPDRLDALVWALTELMLEPGQTGLLDYYREKAGRRDSRA